MSLVPEKTVVFFCPNVNNDLKPFDMNISSFLKPLNTSHKRDWFTPHFYKCLPLSIGNMQGFVVSVPYSFSVLWNGGEKESDLIIALDDESNDYLKMNHVRLSSDFGHGILTIILPITLKTPSGVNLMTIAAPNFPIAGMSPMTGVVETDNLKFFFTLNIKIDLPNTLIKVDANYPLVGIIPVPRYFCDSFSLKNAYDLFSNEDVEKEVFDIQKQNIRRHEQKTKLNNKTDGFYYKGIDINGNKFADHQLPGDIK